MQLPLSVAVGEPTHIPHNSKIDDAENRYFRIRHGLEDIPDLPFSILHNRLDGSYHCAPG